MFPHYLLPKRWKSTISVSSRQWLQRQAKDPYVKEAAAKGYRARSAFKLLEINEKYKILHPGMTVIECGSAPGAWTQIGAKLVNAQGLYNNCQPQGTIIGCDLLNIDPVDGAHLLSYSDFTSETTQAKIQDLMQNRGADLVMSDMAPNSTGMSSMDHDLIIKLVFSALRFSLKTSNVGASFLCKIWNGHETEKLKITLEKFYEKVHEVKPRSSRSESSEMFLLARKFVGIEK